ncbi:MAG TPA: CBS domain-containing protein [Xanthobacteraceae bacterium]|jgi:CBS domain-containing protein|nr:CBS domain-containing protein [Xanthobacteraceae bacterium]
MKTVRHLLEGKRHKLISASPHDTVYDALKKMAEHDVGALIVMEGDQLVGIFSERDYARKIILHGKSSKDTLVREIMTSKVLFVRPNQTVEDCMALMTDKRVRHLPVLDDGKVIGVVSIGDVVKEMLSEQKFIIEQLEHYIMG